MTDTTKFERTLLPVSGGMFVTNHAVNKDGSHALMGADRTTRVGRVWIDMDRQVVGLEMDNDEGSVELAAILGATTQESTNALLEEMGL